MPSKGNGEALELKHPKMLAVYTELDLKLYNEDLKKNIYIQH